MGRCVPALPPIFTLILLCRFPSDATRRNFSGFFSRSSNHDERSQKGRKCVRGGIDNISVGQNASPKLFQSISILISVFALAAAGAACGGSDKEDKPTNTDAGIVEDAGIIEDASISHECEAGHFGTNCAPCTCQNGTCNDGKDGDGKCTSCNNECWTGENCDSPNDGPLDAKIKDDANNSYNTTCIGGRIWMAENLRYEHGNAHCYANTAEHADFVEDYGCLYDVEDVEKLKLCPAGWHVPTSQELNALLEYAGGPNKSGAQNLRDKEWDDGRDAYGFAALPAGFHEGSHFYGYGTAAKFWSGETHSCVSLCSHILSIGSNTASIDSLVVKNSAFSVRCIKDADE